MIQLLARQRSVHRRRDVRRLIVGGVLLLAASAAWHVILPSITLMVARSSIGCDARNQLLTDVVQGLYPHLPVKCDETTLGRPYLSSDLLQRGGLIRWYGARPFWEPDEEFIHLANERLCYLGCLRGAMNVAPRPEGFDAHGIVTLFVIYQPMELGGSQERSRRRLQLGCAIVRFGGQSAAIAGLVVSDSNKIDWADLDGDGATELVFGRLVPRGTKRQVNAAFRLSDNGVPFAPDLRPDSGVQFWIPPDGQPVPIPAGASVEKFCRTLAPWPDAFTPPKKAPTSTRSWSP